MRTENEKLCARVSELEGKISSLNDTANEMEQGVFGFSCR